MKFTSITAIILICLSLAACASRTTDYTNPVPTNISASWRLANVQVIVPESLTTSEQNSYAPEADIVWHGDVYGAGSRQQQVAAILKNGITDAASRLSGATPVIIQATLLQFHALTPKARVRVGGIHNVDFTLRIINANTGAVLVEQARIEADEFAYAGAAAVGAEALGQTQKVRIRNRINLVLLNWLGIAKESERVTLGGVSGIGR
ncbi:MAG: DUF6778 family protein [Paracoccaceae bacterium]